MCFSIIQTVLVRASDYASGAVAVYHAAHGKVYTGVSRQAGTHSDRRKRERQADRQ